MTAENSAISETTTEPIVRLDDDSNVTDGVLALAAEAPQHPVYAVRNGAGGWLDITVTSFLNQVRSVAKGLIGLGLTPGDAVAVMSSTSYSWAVVDQAIWFAGGVAVPIYETSSAHQIAQLLADSKTELVLVEDAHLLGKAQSGANMSAGKDSGIVIRQIGSTVDLEEISAHGTEVTDEALEAARSAARADDVATIVYTSGTTGKPKGVKITHRNLAEGAANLLEFSAEIHGEPLLGSPAHAEGAGYSRILMFLPLAHVLARAVQVACLHRGIQMAHTGDTATLVEDLGSYQPTWLLVVPRVLEKVYHGAAAKAHSEGKGKIFDAAKDTAISYSKALEDHARGKGSGPSFGLRARHRVFDALVYSKLRARLGGEATHLVSGASPLNPEIGHFFTGVGVFAQEGYGLTESTAPITLNVPGATRIGTVGLPVPGNTVKIAEDGEILLKGSVIFAGYHNDDDATDEAFDEDGYFRSGDLGSLDTDGFLTITGRKKELIVTAGGKNVYPTPLEETVRVHPLVAQIVVVGDNRPFVSALVFPDREGVSAWAEHEGYGALSVAEILADEQAAEALRSEVQSVVDKANERVSRAESIRTFTLVDAELTEESGHLTPSMKLQRAKVVEDFTDTVDALYS